ncbi:hypothetical protein T4A_4839 [Trichinella pseudospiralis]|uniref:Uncharacterized protein n=1 Tax=Trichinella pseudospiralis TaxID=6337 RepID=A0A0V1EBY1_TRIPS|nr:hypothetical protein T4A_4839 [Trichinella pseudospiralis]KRY86421.1 hypothetical protein T4D_10308 [Trichinella pseudospiralis]
MLKHADLTDSQQAEESDKKTRFQRDDRHSVKIVNLSALLTHHSDHKVVLAPRTTSTTTTPG